MREFSATNAQQRRGGNGDGARTRSTVANRCCDTDECSLKNIQNRIYFMYADAMLGSRGAGPMLDERPRGQGRLQP